MNMDDVDHKQLKQVQGQLCALFSYHLSLTPLSLVLEIRVTESREARGGLKNVRDGKAGDKLSNWGGRV